MASHHIFKMSKGFTLIEILLVVALIGILGVSSQVFVLPAVQHIVCEREKTLLLEEIEHARFTAQYAQHDVRILSDSDIVFRSGRGDIKSDFVELPISSCNQSVKINHLGEII